MAQLNKGAVGPKLRTHEGGVASRVSAAEELRRSVMCTMLWEDSFYENGVDIAQRIKELTTQVPVHIAAEIMIKAKEEQYLRHAPLWIAAALAKKGYLSAGDLERIITRADDLTEFLAMYWAEGKCPVSHQVRKGLAKAFAKFDEYQLAKYDRAKAVKLKDVLRMVRPKPANREQSKLWGRLIAGQLAVPDTWETQLSSGADKKETFLRLIAEDKLGDLAFLRNLRKMLEVGVPEVTLRNSVRGRAFKKILPYQFITAARYAPALEEALEGGMLRVLSEMDKFKGQVNLLVDTSGSMSSPIAEKSELRRIDVAAGLAILIRELCDDPKIYAFNTMTQRIAPRRGFALRDAIGNPGGGTYMWNSIRMVAGEAPSDLTIVITDEETSDSGIVAEANTGLLVIINVANAQRGVGYGKGSLHISGWSENVIRYLQEYLKG